MRTILLARRKGGNVPEKAHSEPFKKNGFLKKGGGSRLYLGAGRLFPLPKRCLRHCVLLP